MKKLIFTVCFLGALLLTAQENNNGITLGAYIPEQSEGIPTHARNMLKNKLNRIITENGISDNVYNPRFILVPNITVLNKNITGTAPAMVVLNIDLSLYIGDGIGGNLFASESIPLKGVGTNENKAYIAALKTIKPNSPNIKSFVSKSKQKIIEYYDQNCELLVKKSQNLEAQNEFGEALFTLSSVPEVSSCFDNVKSKLRPLYIKAINRDCEVKFNEASAIWAANQDLEAANAAGLLLSGIEPMATCFPKAKTLYENIAERIKAKELLDREWHVKLKELDNEKSSIQAARDVGVAYGLNQQPTYNIRGWY
ncbi:hypothetical protein H7U19_01065 [Hyunsoonleella sp. SJ7]|uniref:Uncharacterized protein n=1 Tax=Hyunsoonleella aquatilis TaxID=2762758 RepID=A0A923H9N7_9FLAO|nr:hypothetical protein [Hyunsoonleella aquatilis]MBC3756974.1 hypothetical protein [Hyunsoonleella aquatilis]